MFRIYVADTLGDLLFAQRGLASADFSAFQEWLAPQLGELMGLAAGLDAQVRAVVEGQETLRADVGEIKVALLVLNTEVERGNQAAREVINTLGRLERRLDFAIAGHSVQRFGVPDPPKEALELLKAKHQAARLVARERDLASLWRWIEGGERISARLIVGRGGAGKTRLAFEFLLQIAERLPNWEAGLLTGTVLRKFDATKQPSDWRWSAPTLVVVDYAQPLAAPLGELLRALTHRRRQADLPPLRLLLLERAPGGWFEDLLNQEDSGGQCAVRELFDPPEPVELTPIPTGQLRRAVLTQVLEKAAGLAGRPPPPLPAEGDSTFAKSLNRDLFAEPLNLYMAALAASDLGLNAALNRSRPDLALVLAGKELERICRFVRHAGNDAQETLLCHLAACATVERGFTDDECRRAVAEEYEVLGRSWPDGLGDLQEVLERALPGERLPVASIEPDFIGEAVVLKMLAKPAPGASARWARWRATMARCFQRDPFATASTLMNAFQNFGHLEGHGEALLQATERLIEVGLADTARPLLVCIEAALPQQTVTLRPHAVRVTQAIYEQLKDRVTPNNEPSLRAELARVASNLGVRLSNLGRRLEALPPAEEAVKLYRELFEQNPDAFRPALATSLNNLANRLSELGRRLEALPPAEEAVKLYRELFEQNPDAFRPDLAKSLGMMGQVREANQQADLALECFAQGIRVLAPQFMSLPTAFAQIMGQLGQDYLRLAERLGREPDASLLTPVAEVLQRLESGAPPGKGAPPDL